MGPVRRRHLVFQQLLAVRLSAGIVVYFLKSFNVQRLQASLTWSDSNLAELEIYYRKP